MLDISVGQVIANSVAFTLASIILCMFTLSYQSEQTHLRINTPVKCLAFGITTLALLVSWTFLLGIDHSLLAFGISLGLTTALMRPCSALCFFVICISIRPWELLSQLSVLGDLTELSLAVTVASLMLHRLRNKNFLFYFSALYIPFVLFLLWVLLGTLFLGHMEEGLPYFSTYFTPIVALLLLLPQCVRSSRDLELVTSTVIAVCLGITLQALQLTLSDPPIGIDGVVRLQSRSLLLGNSNDLASIIVLALPLTLLGWVVRKRSLAVRSTGILVCFIFLLGLWFAQSRGAILALGLSVAIYFFTLKSRGLAKNILVLSILIAALAFAITLQRNVDDLSGSSEARWNYFVTGINMLKTNPFFGVGIGNYSKRYEQYTHSFYEWGERTAHSSWTLAMAETGAPGLLFFFLIFVLALRASFRIRHQHPELFLALLAYLIAISFLSHTYFFLPYLMASLPISAYSVLGEKSQTTTT